MLRHKLFAAAATGGIGLGLVFASAGVASAATTFPEPGSPNGYGFDANAHLVVGGGSTTLFKMAQSLSALWEDTAGCISNNNVNDPAGAQPITYPQVAPAFNQCSPSTGQTYAGDSAGGNFDADTIAIATSAGSGTGLESLNGSNAGAAGTFAYEGAQSNLATTGDPNALTLPAGDQLSNGYGTVDFDTSSRGPKTSGGNCSVLDSVTNSTGDELGCDTFWGVASDGVGVYTFDSAAGVFTSQSGNPANVGLSAQSMYEIYNCDISTWGDLPEYQAAKTAGYTGLPDANAPIVAWAMNSTSGTYGDFDTWIQNNAVANGAIPAPSGFKADTAGCARDLTTAGGATLGAQPLENDFKPLIVEAGTNAFNPNLYVGKYPAAIAGSSPLGPPPNVGPEGPPPNYVGVNNLTTFPAGVSTAAAALDSPQNPNNWIWFGSWGLLTQFPFLSCAGQTTPNCPTTVSTPTGAVSFTSGANAVNSTFTIATDSPSGPGTSPGQTVIQGGSYPIERILSIVTKKSDADCPLSATTPPVCNFTTGTPGPGPVNGNGSTDFNVLGPSSGKGGAVREFVRFLCRPGTGFAVRRHQHRSGRSLHRHQRERTQRHRRRR